MGILDDLSDIAKRAGGGNASATEVDSAYDQVAEAVPQSSLADGLSHAFKSDQTPPFERMVSGLFEKSSPDQKAGLLNQLLGALGSSGAMQALGASGALAGLGGLLSGGRVTPQEAERIPPEAVEVLAQQAATKDPSIVDRAAGFYAQHPTLVKVIGIGALALLMSRISARR